LGRVFAEKLNPYPVPYIQPAFSDHRSHIIQTSPKGS
jgi:hypothetical protein